MAFNIIELLKNNKDEEIKTIIKKQMPEDDFYQILFLLCQNKKLYLIKYLFSKNTNREISSHKISPIIDDIAKKGYLDVIRTVLKYKQIESLEDSFAIIEASQQGHIDIVKLLLKDDRFEPNFWGNMAIALSYSHNHKNITEILWHDERVKNTFDIKLKINKNIAPYLKSLDLKNKFKGF